MMSLFVNLQQTVAKQQRMLQVLLQQQQQKMQQQALFASQVNALPLIAQQMQKEQCFQEAIKMRLLQKNMSQTSSTKEEHVETTPIKEVHDTLNPIVIKREDSMDTADSSDHLSQPENTELLKAIEEANTDNEEKDDFKIFRRNGFKADEKNSEEMSLRGPRKSNKLITPKKPPSKAKHLWINYGRKIIEFALTHTRDETQARIKHLVGKLGSKKDFEDVFGIKNTDSEVEKAFKVLFGKLALIFIKTKAESAFEDSKYRDQMITQKNIVAFLIAKLISC